MLTTMQSIVDDARKLIDVAAQSSYTDAQIAAWAEEGVRRMYAVRPSSRYGDGAIDDQVFPPQPPPPLPDSASAADRAERNAEIATKTAALMAFEVRVNEPRWRAGVVYFAVARAHEVGVTDSVNLQLAQTMKRQADEVFMS